MRRLVIGILIALNSYYAPVLASTAEHSQKSVLVTGASSGIGKNIAHTLAAKGYRVYAGARKPADLKALNSIENIRSIRLDVTIQEEIDAAVDFIRNESGGLYGLVNNAGVLFAGPNIEVDIEQVKWLFDVNVFGVHRVTRAFAAMLIEGGGRIVNNRFDCRQYWNQIFGFLQHE
jgi:NAD(P)-dependent dehydrogenase (short-subunit alcohol dehydrogenase family)